MDVAQIDRDLEARKHLWKGLQRLSPRGRVRFLQAMCDRVSTTQHGAETRVTDHTGTTHEAYYDLMLLSVNHGLDLSDACNALERWLKTKAR